MKLFKFDDYESYINAQVKGTERRIRRRQRSGMDGLEVNMIALLVNECVEFIICHGSGNGVELSLFREQFPKAKVIGTDLVEWGEGTVKWDFNQPKDEWTGIADIVYTNSLDHSPDPLKTLEVWFAQLKAKGKLFIQWNLNHVMMMKKGGIYVGGDCFMSHLDEFVHIIDRVGDVKDVRFVAKSRRGGMRFLVVAEKRL